MACKESETYVDPVYEADAPKFVDFTKLDQDDPEIDAWFDQHFDDNEYQVDVADAELYQAHLQQLQQEVLNVVEAPVVFSDAVSTPPAPLSSIENDSGLSNSSLRVIKTRIVTSNVCTVETTLHSEAGANANKKTPSRKVAEQKTVQNKVLVERNENAATRQVKISTISKNVGQKEAQAKETSKVELQLCESRKQQTPKSKLPTTIKNVNENQKPAESAGKNPLLAKQRSASVDRLAVKEKLTIPVTPKLATATRSRGASRDNLAAKDLDGQNDHIIKARPVPKKLLESPTMGVVKPKPRTPTKCIEPKFELDRRLGVRRSFRCNNNASSASSRSQTPERKVTKVPADVVPKATTVEPFSFQKKEDELIERRRRLAEEHNKIQPVQHFRAQPAPTCSPAPLPQKKPKTPTVAKPFTFLTDNVHLAYEERLREKLAAEEKARKQAAEFHAAPADVLHRVPFRPVHEEHKPTEVDEFCFETQKRSEDWKRYDEVLKAKEAEKQAVLKQRQMEEERRLEEQIKQMRLNAVHKAQPVKKYKDVGPRQKVDPTVSHAPNFLIDQRLKDRQNKQ